MKLNMKTCRATTAVVILSALAAGCTPSTQPEPPQAGLTTRAVCESLQTLFTEKFQAIEVDAQSITDGHLFDEPISISASCEVSSSADKAFYGKIIIRNAPHDPNPIGSAVANYVETIVDGETVLVFDKRKDSKWAMSSVEIAASIGGWFGELRVDPETTRTAAGSLNFTETEQKSAAQYLIAILRRAAESQA
ncbi:hypothetical protein [Nocardia carnea]|uniref:hypothetical protein n=1 Tax=Nocardia carnea TaxID=37328 RepID=UPI002457C85C|nr:hypothetical protein [Nocardia carnea]